MRRNFSQSGILWITFAAMLVLSSRAHTKNLISTDNEGIAIGGYDPVAYFTRGVPTKGIDNIKAVWQGATYHFSSKVHREMFVAAPTKYTPSYGGFCAFGMRYGQKSIIDPTQWQIVEGRLHLLLNRGTKTMWERATAKNIEIADRVWGTLQVQQN